MLFNLFLLLALKLAVQRVEINTSFFVPGCIAATILLLRRTLVLFVG
jgi:hypothetical protein